jgi:tRNA(Ile)-lysidine synthase
MGSGFAPAGRPGMTKVIGCSPSHKPIPLSLGELDAALSQIGGFEPRPLIAVGVSGGPDSMALMILADRWARARGGEARALIVDHGLRPESTAEAETVGAWLAARGIPHAVLVWRGDKPAAGIQEAARAARYRLLAEWCSSRGCLHLLTAHHREDQAETYLIRRHAGSGGGGLAAMPAVRELPGLRLVRPLLAVPKARLQALLDAEGQRYIRDPSNSNPAFARARLRMSGESVSIDAALALVREHGAARIARECELAALLAQAVSLHPAGFAALDPAALAVAGELGAAALGRVATVLGGAAYPLRRERLARLRQALFEQPFRGRTLGGCRFVPWRGRALALRETTRAAPPLSLQPGMSGMWDGRFAVSLSASAPRAVTIAPLGVDGVAMLGRHAIDDDNPLPRLIYPTLPAIWDAGGLAAVPHLGYRRADEPDREPATMAHLPVFAFRPAVSLFSAGFTVV